MNKKRQRREIGGDNGFEEWGGYMAAKKSKLRGQFKDQVKKHADNLGETTDIFQNVAVFVNGYTVPSADDIKRIMMVHGGIYHHYFSCEHTTHIIATNLPDVKIRQLKSLHVNIVKPEWITACLDAKRQVDFRPFLLYSHQSRAQPSIRNYAEVSVPAPANDIHVNESDQTNLLETEEPPLEDSCDRTENELDLELRESSEDLFASPEIKEKCDHAPSTLNTNEFVSDISEIPNVSELHPEINPGPSKANNTARTASEPNFLAEFYRNSRLHHISTMGAMFKQYVSELRRKKNEFPGLTRLKKWKEKKPSGQKLLCDEEEEFGDSLDGSIANHGSTSRFPESGKIIMHIDMDCFFVSVGLRRYPHLKGKPVAVTHSKGNTTSVRNGVDRKYEFNYYKERQEAKLKSKSNSEGKESMAAQSSRMDNIEDTDSMAEIASCSYEARKKGVKNGMFVGAALKLCPDLEIIPYDFEGYDQVAKTLYDTVASYTADIEAVSCDEMLVDCTEVLQKSKCSPIEFATFLRREIKEKTQCPASTGFGSNRLLARLGTRKAKPDGMFFLEPSMVVEFMKSVNVKDLPGVGRAMASQLHSMGVFTCGDLQQMSKAELSEMGNKTGELLYGLCRGLDNRPLNFDHQRKSVSAEVNYGIRFKNQQQANVFIRQLSEEVQTRLAEAKVKGSCITLKLMVRAKDAPSETAKYMGHGVCDTMTRSSKLPRTTGDVEVIEGEVLLMMKKLNVNPCDLRGLGIQISQLESLNSTSTGALDKFVVKNNLSSTAIPNSKPTVKPTETSSTTIPNPKSTVKPTETSKGKTAEPQTLPRKNKVFSNKGTLGIDQFMVSRKKTTRKDNFSKLPAPNDLDLEVLEALPEDIRNEVLEAYSTSASNKEEGYATKPAASSVNLEISYSQVDPTFLEALPSDMRKELEADFHRRKTHKQLQRQLQSGDSVQDAQPGPSNQHNNEMPFCLRDKSILKSFIFKPTEVKDMIRQWLLQETDPQLCDIHILEHYLCDLVHEKNIDDLHVIFKFFQRLISAHSSSVWKRMFHDILSTVQANMQQVYQSSLQVDNVELPSSP